jgi:hypothetical protein
MNAHSFVSIATSDGTQHAALSHINDTGLRFTKAGYFNLATLTSGTTVAWDAGSAQSATLTLGHNVTISDATNHAAGGVYLLRIVQGATAKTVSWGSGYKWPGGSAPTMTATASAVDVFTFVSDGTNMYGSFSGSQNY